MPACGTKTSVPPQSGTIASPILIPKPSTLLARLMARPSKEHLSSQAWTVVVDLSGSRTISTSAPRLGFAYQLSQKLTVRAGSGIFFTPTSAMLGYDGGGQSPGYTSQTPWVSTVNNQGYIPGNPVSNPFPNGLVKPTGNAAGDQTLIGIGVGQVWLKGPHPVGELYQWSADLQYQVSAHSVAEIGIHRCAWTETVVRQP